MMQAYIDDSMSDKEVLILGGLIATVERWEAFSVAWQARLDHAPWSAFKMSEVWHRGGDISLEHAKWHYYTIRDHVQGAICVTVPLAPLEQASMKYGLSGTAASNPYTWAFKGIMNGLARNQEEWGLDKPVDFIFDERPEENQVREVWDYYLTKIPENVRVLTGRRPMFEDDKKVLPLQAADLWAWWCRKTWLDNSGIIRPDTFPVPWGKAGDIPQIILQWSADKLDNELARVASHLSAASRNDLTEKVQDITKKD